MTRGMSVDFDCSGEYDSSSSLCVLNFGIRSSANSCQPVLQFTIVEHVERVAERQLVVSEGEGILAATCST